MNVYNKNKLPQDVQPDEGAEIKNIGPEPKAQIIVEVIEYMEDSVASKTIIKKSGGDISVMSFDTGEGLMEKTSPFTTFAQIIEGEAEIVIDKVPHILRSGQGIIIPAQTPNFIKPNGRFKMIMTIIRGGAG